MAVAVSAVVCSVRVGCSSRAGLRFRLGLCGLGVEGGDPEDVVGGPREQEPGSVALSASVAELAAPGDGLDPAEGFLDPGPDPLAGPVPGVAGGATVDRGTPVRRVRGDV